MKQIVIIGLGSSGFSSALSAKKTDSSAKITIIDKKQYDMFSPCGLPFVIEGKIPTFEELIHKFPTEQMGMTKLLRHEVLKINTKEKYLDVKNLENGELKKINYDSLIIATGTEPMIPPVSGAREFIEKGVYFVSNPENSKKVLNATKKSKNAVVVGAGAVGLEVAIALKERGLNVLVVEMLTHAFPKSIDNDISKILEEHLVAKGIKMMFGKPLERVEGKDKVEKVFVSGEEIPCDMVIMASGVRANISLANEAGIEIGEFKAIKVNSRMETNIKDVYASGDCTQIFSCINNQAWVSQLATSAYKQGQIAGINSAGGNAFYDGALTTFVSKIGDLEVASTGFNESFAEQFGYDFVVGKARGESKPHWFPEAKKITVKIIADRKTSRIIGCQAIGEEGAGWRVNVVAMAIKMRATLTDLANTELCYCPAVSESYDVLIRACEFALRRVKK